ncbi:hypothetical protein EVAR_57719_1 [Eumeta japonica]|uniref:Uncharacterized protein n=1 Tax=Eumeta variegata TaxID=151549 RepID=A0A4C1YA41_EUMVA|nr:hypothetical protein EVAR_57719_1 [Eumeta japonica]
MRNVVQRGSVREHWNTNYPQKPRLGILQLKSTKMMTASPKARRAQRSRRSNFLGDGRGCTSVDPPGRPGTVLGGRLFTHRLVEGVEAWRELAPVGAELLAARAGKFNKSRGGTEDIFEGLLELGIFL